MILIVENLKRAIARYANVSGNGSAALLLVCAMLSSCGGGGSNGGSGGQPPPPAITFDLVYPGEVSLTDANQVSVVGLANASRLTSVIVKNGSNETAAQLDSSGRWRATAVPLVTGSNRLVVELTENDGLVTEIAIAEIQSSPILSNPIGALFDSTNNRVLVLDPKQLLSFDLSTNELEILSAPAIGAGADFGFTRHFALDGTGAIIISSFRGIQRVDPSTGDRSEHIVLPNGSGPISTIAHDQLLNRMFAVGFFGDLYVADLSAAPPILATTIKTLPPFGFGVGGPTDSVFVASTDSIYTVSMSSLDVIKIDVSTGDSEPIFLDFGNFVTPTVGIDYDNVASRLLVLGASGAVFSLDPIAQTSGIFHPPSTTTTVPVSRSGLSIGNDKLWSVSQLPGELRSIELTTGLQSIEASSPVGEGAPPGPMLTGRYDSATDRFIAIADLRVIAIDPKTGSRQHLANLQDPAQFPAPPSFILASGIALSQDGARAWVSDMFNQTVVEVDLASGEVREASGPNVGIGPLPDQISGIAVNAQNSSAYLTDRFAQHIFRVDLGTGQRDLLVDLSSTIAEGQLRSLVLDSGSNRLLLNVAPLRPSSNITPAIYALDLVSLELTLLVDLSTVELPLGESTTPGFLTPHMSLSSDGDTLYTPVSGNADVPYARIDLLRGEAVALGTASTGVPFFAPNAIEVTPDNRLFALDGTGAMLIVDPETGERSIVSK
ncbi:MAG: hypothetical protein OEU90_11735 [Gammaproteobacteria bacterium]|nr:hypothetical protein [Gammaproteobacteria bacterium]MDH3806126.1 hypothetical protein [Gammaproteobacteria bacterium]